MIKKIFLGIFALLMVLSTVWLVRYFMNNSGKNPIVYKTETPFKTDIIKKTVATGSINPRKEIQIKPQVSGIIQEIFVEPGQVIKAGALVARVKLVPNLNGLNQDQIGINNAQNNLKTAQINYKNAKVELDRQKKLFDQKVISEREYNQFLLDFNVQKEALQAARANLNLVNQGALQRSGGVSNDVFATTGGMVLDVPVKAGASVIERNNFNEGTTIASIADMQSLIFEGKIDESEVGKIKEGMELKLTIGALEDKKYKATLEYISPKGVEEEGAIKFDIRAKIFLKEGDYLRAGYSANADIVLDKKRNVLAIKESMLQFEKKDKNSNKKEKVYVEVEEAKQVFKKKYVKTGISDGINIEIKSGLSKKDKVKLPLEKDDKKQS